MEVRMAAQLLLQHVKTPSLNTCFYYLFPTLLPVLLYLQ